MLILLACTILFIACCLRPKNGLPFVLVAAYRWAAFWLTVARFIDYLYSLGMGYWVREQAVAFSREYRSIRGGLDPRAGTEALRG